MFDISVIIVSWNTKKFLYGCLKSIYKTTHNVTFEVFVVDNNSLDGSPEMVAKEFPQVNLICTGANLGFAKANNIGIKRSQGRYVCLVNSDVVILDNCIDTMWSYLEKNPSIGILGPRILNPDMTLQLSYKGFFTFWNFFCRVSALDKIFPRSKLFAGYEMSYFPGDIVCNVDILIGAFWMVRRESLNEVGLLDEDFFIYAEDMDWCKRFKKADWDVVYLPDAKVVHYSGASSSNAPVRFYIEMQRSFMQYWKKHHNLFSRIVFYLMMMLYNILRAIGWSIVFLIIPSKRQNSGHKIKRYAAGINLLLRIFG